MRDPNIVKFSHSKLVYVESIKTISLHVVNGISVWIKTVQERGKNASYESSQVSRVVAKHWELENSVMVPAFFFTSGEINYFIDMI